MVRPTLQSSPALTLDLNLVLEVRVVEDLHGNLDLAVVLGLELGVEDGHVLLDVLARENNVAPAVAANVGHESPVADDGREAREEEEEGVDGREREVRDREDLPEEVGDCDHSCAHVVVAERAVTIERERSVVERWSRCDLGTDGGIKVSGPA